MTSYIATVKGDSDYGYIASFPDFPGCVVAASTLDQAIAKAREALLVHIERLLEANHTICCPTSAGAIERGDALLLATVDVPDDLRIAHVEVSIPALALARIDSFARRSGLTRGSLFVQAVDRWAAQATMARDRRSEVQDGPTLFDFGNPLELRVGTIATEIGSVSEDAADQRGLADQVVAIPDSAINDITAELERLLEQPSQPRPSDGKT